MHAHGRHLILMGKPPLIGRVKTRLSDDIGAVPAVQFYRQSVTRLLHRLDLPREWSLRLAVNASPDEHYACWPDHVRRMGQGEGSLGDRMKYVLDSLPPGPVVIIGTDSPQVEPRHIREAFTALGAADAVFGPAEDGGYWLIGLARRKPAPALFDNVQWSTPYALDDTLMSLPEDFRIRMLEELIDVDTGEDLSALTDSLGPIRFGPWADVPPSEPAAE